MMGDCWEQTVRARQLPAVPFGVGWRSRSSATAHCCVAQTYTQTTQTVCFLYSQAPQGVLIGAVPQGHISFQLLDCLCACV